MNKLILSISLFAMLQSTILTAMQAVAKEKEDNATNFSAAADYLQTPSSMANRNYARAQAQMILGQMYAQGEIGATELDKARARAYFNAIMEKTPNSPIEQDHEKALSETKKKKNEAFIYLIAKLKTSSIIPALHEELSERDQAKKDADPLLEEKFWNGDGTENE